jgi:hypothetical protein
VDEGHLFPELGHDLLPEGFLIVRFPVRGGGEGKSVEGEPFRRELIQPASELVSFVPHDGDELLDLESLNGLLIGIAPGDISLGMAVPPQAKGGGVFPLADGAEQVVCNRLGIEFGVRIRCPLADEEDIGHQEIFSERLHGPEAAHLEGAEIDVQR